MASEAPGQGQRESKSAKVGAKGGDESSVSPDSYWTGRCSREIKLHGIPHLKCSKFLVFLESKLLRSKGPTELGGRAPPFDFGPLVHAQAGGVESAPPRADKVSLMVWFLCGTISTIKKSLGCSGLKRKWRAGSRAVT